ncbi:MAG: ATP-binding protein [Actinomycetota bacterium]|nr:ATP-binding protein [Actinomycetota bacterium]
MGADSPAGERTDVTREQERLRQLEVWISWIRLGAVAWAVLEVAVVTHGYPPGYQAYAWATTAVLAVGAAVLAWLARRRLEGRRQAILSLSALAFDTGIVFAYFVLYSFEPTVPTRALVFLVVVEAAVRYAFRGGIALPLATAPLLAYAEWSRADRFGPPDFDVRNVTIPLGVELIMGLIIGGLVNQLRHETAVAESQAHEAEELRDEIGRHADQLEVVNRAARALSSSLELDEAFRLFVREVRTALAFDRLALILADRDHAVVFANVGVAENELFPRGTSFPIEDTILRRLLEDPRTIVRGDLDENPESAEERELADAGLRSRIVAPLTATGRTFGMISVSRCETNAFTADDAELITLLGRQLTTAIENIRAFDAERTAGEELRRLSALRADFVSLVSHELRGPMASVIGCAATLRQRWRSLSPAQRESFLGLIEEETSRLAELVGDVLDTSRVEAGTFTFTFSNVDLAELVREVAAVVDLGQEEVSVRADVDGQIPPVRADRERIRQLLMNLVTNAVKYTVAGDEVQVRAASEDGAVFVSVADHGPGISREEQSVIFEKFGRATTASGSKPGAGLGLFIARSIAEAHGGALDVESEEGEGAKFTLRLPTPS